MRVQGLDAVKYWSANANALQHLPQQATENRIKCLLEISKTAVYYRLQQKPVKSRSGGCLERSGDRKLTVSMTVGTTVPLSLAQGEPRAQLHLDSSLLAASLPRMLTEAAIGL